MVCIVHRYLTGKYRASISYRKVSCIDILLESIVHRYLTGKYRASIAYCNESPIGIVHDRNYIVQRLAELLVHRREPGSRASALPVLKQLLYYSYSRTTSTDTATRRWPIQRCGRGFSLSRDRIRLNLTWSVEYWWLSTAIFACDYSVGKAVNSTILLRRRCVSNRLGISKFLNINVTPRFLTACVFVSDRTLGNYCGGGMLCWTCGRGSNR